MPTSSSSPLLPKRASGQPPAIALGTMNFGKRTPAPEASQIVRRAIERGVRIFDTANVYNAGESEKILGRALGKDRDKVTIASKVGANRIAGKPEGLAKGTIAGAIEATLARLGTDHVDVYYLHMPDASTPIEESLAAFASLLETKRILSWGASNYSAWQMLEMCGVAATLSMPPPCVAQLLYNALHRELDIEYFAFARKYGMHTTVYNPLAAGLLAGTHTFEGEAPRGSRFDGNAMYRKRYWTRTMFDRAEELKGVAKEAGMSLLQLSYAWLASRPDVDSVLIGPATIQHLDEAIDALSLALPQPFVKKIDDLAVSWMGSDTHYVR